MKITPITTAVPKGDESPFVQVNFTAAELGSIDGSGRFDASPIEAFIRVVKGQFVPQSLLDSPKQDVSLRLRGYTECEVYYLRVDDVSRLLRHALAGDESGATSALEEENRLLRAEIARIKDRMDRAKALLDHEVIERAF